MLCINLSDFNFCTEKLHHNIFAFARNQERNGGLDNDRYIWIQQCLLQGIMLWQTVSGASDRAIQSLLSFLRSLLIVIADTLGYNVLSYLMKSLPSTLYAIRRFLGIDRERYSKYVVCPTCHMLYDYADVLRLKAVDPRCKHILWPNHSYHHMRKKCGTKLLSEITKRPTLIYTVASIISYLEIFVSQPGFLSLCNEWRKLKTLPGYINDIYDGQIWKELASSDYLGSEYNLVIMLNVDWLQPYKHSPYSLGAIYGVILNLPRRIRFKDRYVMLLGVIPGPSEPSLDINTYLQPIVDELKVLENGAKLKDASAYGNKYRVRLLGCASDVPATRKLGGFLGHSATKGE